MFTVIMLTILFGSIAIMVLADLIDSGPIKKRMRKSCRPTVPYRS